MYVSAFHVKRRHYTNHFLLFENRTGGDVNEIRNELDFPICRKRGSKYLIITIAGVFGCE